MSEEHHVTVGIDITKDGICYRFDKPADLTDLGTANCCRGLAAPPVFKLGDEVRDIISGFGGIVTCVSEWLNGCVRVTVCPQELKEDGGLISSECFDVEQLEIVQAGAVKIGDPSGGDRDDVTSPICPSR